MKKHIMIAGVPRAGKSTVSRRIAKAYGYSHISMDAIIAGFERCFPETGINTYADMPSMEILRAISGRIAPFLGAVMKSGEYARPDAPMVIDVYQMLPEDYVRHIDRSRCDVFYFLTADVTPEERLKIQKTYDTPEEYTYFLPEEQLREGCAYMVEQSRLIREQCLRYGLPFYETSRDRERVIEGFLRSLAGELSEK